MANCRVCKHNYKPSTCEPKCARMCDGESDFEPITNGDKIRKMSDEELAEFLAETELHGSQGSYKDYLEWLKSPTTD